MTDHPIVAISVAIFIGITLTYMPFGGTDVQERLPDSIMQHLEN